MINEIITANGEWLMNSVPLWVFLIALLTSPAEWSAKIVEAVEERLGSETPAAGGR